MKHRIIAVYFSTLVCSAILVCVYAAALGRIQYSFDPDSAFYVEAGRSFAAGTGFDVTAGFTDTTRDVEPMRLWPPGFPVAIGAISAGGVSAKKAALVVTIVSWIFLPVLVVFALRPAIGSQASIAIAVLVALSPGALQVGRIASSDIPFLDLTLISIGLIVRASQHPSQHYSSQKLWLWLWSGIFAGIAYEFRNVGVALFAAVFATFIAMATLKLWSNRLAVTRAATFTCGVLLIVIPMMAYNAMVFGTVQPYSMPPSTIGLVVNSRGFIESQLFDLSANKEVAALAWNGAYLALVGLIVGLLAIGVALRSWRAADISTRFFQLLLALYIGAGAAVVVLARTKYEWGDAINERHTMQYTWSILALTVVAVLTIPVSRRTKRWLQAAALSLAGVLLVARVANAWNGYVSILSEVEQIAAADSNAALAERQANGKVVIRARAISTLLANDTRLLDYVRHLDMNSYLASNRGDVLSIETGRHVRRLDAFKNVAKLNTTLAAIRASLPCDQPMYVIAAVDSALLRQFGTSWSSTVEMELRSQFETVEHSANWILLRAKQATSCVEST